jgi:aminoglycoside phosphotransferase family enzyme
MHVNHIGWRSVALSTASAPPEGATDRNRQEGVSMARQAAERADPDLEAKVAFLRQPQAYGDEAAEVDAVETALSWVFLTGQFAYKLKKPIRHDFLDFGSPEARRHYCEEEVRLNGRLAPEVYLGAVPVTETAGGALAVDGGGVPVDWLVKMRRLPADRMLDRAIRTGGVKTRELRIVAGLLVQFFRASMPVAVPPADYRRRLADAVTTSRRTLAIPSSGLPVRSVERTTATLRKFVMGQASLFDKRVRRGRIRDGHGDLRAEHVFLGPKAAVIDCLEYDRESRMLDSADELSLLAVECEILGSPGAGKVILESCCGRLGDAPQPELIAFYKARRAMICARSAILRTDDAHGGDPLYWRGQAETYLALAARYARQID